MIEDGNSRLHWMQRHGIVAPPSQAEKDRLMRKLKRIVAEQPDADFATVPLTARERGMILSLCFDVHKSPTDPDRELFDSVARDLMQIV